MDPSIVVAVISVIVVFSSMLIAYRQYKDNHTDRDDRDLHEKIKEIAQQANEPLKTQIADHTLQFTQQGFRLTRIEELLTHISADQRTFTETVMALAMNSAKGLHQPDPRRAHIDKLLEDFMEGTLTSEERTDLKKLLVTIRNYEPGGPELDFPVYPGEQTMATILLSTMDLVDPVRMAGLGHAAHRSAAHHKNRKENDE